jgi:hypothetical protein
MQGAQNGKAGRCKPACRDVRERWWGVTHECGASSPRGSIAFIAM